MIPIPKDFKEFLKLLSERGIKYLLIGGYAVVYHGYVRSTGDMDIWIATDSENVSKLVAMIEEFGFPVKPGGEGILMSQNAIFRMGIPPLCIEVLTDCSGLEFERSHAARTIADFDGVEVNILSLRDLRINKKASGRLKDLSDLENLPETETPR